MKVLKEIESGKRPMDATSFEVINKMIEKISDDGWNEINKITSPLDELDTTTKSQIQARGWTKANKTIAGLGVAGSAIWITTVTIPDKLNNWGQFGLTNSAEMSTLFGQFDKDTTAERLLQLWFPTEKRKEAMELWLDSAKYYIGIMEAVYKIPIYGEWLKGTTFVGYSSAVSSLGNLDTIMTALENRGLATRDETTKSGWRETTEQERKNIYGKNAEKLFSNDAEWVNKYLNEKKTNVYKSGKSGKELTEAQAMALYYAENGMAVKLSDFGLTASDLNDESLMIAVRKYGENRDTSKKSESESKYSLNELTNMGLTCNMGNTCTQEDYSKNIANGWFVYKDKNTGLATWGQPGDNVGNVEILEKGMRDTVGSGLTGTIGSGGNGGTGGGEIYARKTDTADSSKKTRANPTVSQQQSLDQVKNNEKTLSSKDVDALKVNGVVDITTAKENGIPIQNLAAIDREATVGGFKTYAVDMKNTNKIDKSDYEAMKKEDAAATRAAIRSAYGCDQ
jgi:hypothetical protein